VAVEEVGRLVAGGEKRCSWWVKRSLRHFCWDCQCEIVVEEGRAKTGLCEGLDEVLWQRVRAATVLH